MVMAPSNLGDTLNSVLRSSHFKGYGLRHGYVDYAAARTRLGLGPEQGRLRGDPGEHLVAK